MIPMKKLPKKLQSATGAPIPAHITFNLHYLWNTAFDTYPCGPSDTLSLSHQLSRSFSKLCGKNRVSLPNSYTNQLCKYCSAIQVTGETCYSRVRPRNIRRLRKKYRLANSAKSNDVNSDIKNEIIRHCKICNRVNLVKMGFKRHLSNTRSIIQVSSTDNKNDPAKEKQSSEKPKFSFHESLQRRMSAPAKILNESQDFIPLTSQVDEIITTDISTGKKRYLNLVEREQLNKKLKRRKTLGSMGPSSSTSLPTSPSRPGLASLKSIFNR